MGALRTRCSSRNRLTRRPTSKPPLPTSSQFTNASWDRSWSSPTALPSSELFHVAASVLYKTLTAAQATREARLRSGCQEVTLRFRGLYVRSLVAYRLDSELPVGLRTDHFDLCTSQMTVMRRA